MKPVTILLKKSAELNKPKLRFERCVEGITKAISDKEDVGYLFDTDIHDEVAIKKFLSEQGVDVPFDMPEGAEVKPAAEVAADEDIAKRKLPAEPEIMVEFRSWLRWARPEIGDIYMDESDPDEYKGVLETDDGDYFFHFISEDDGWGWRYFTLRKIAAKIIPGGEAIAESWKTELDETQKEEE